MSLMETAVRRATGEDVDALSSVMAEALMAQPVGVWLVPDVANQAVVLRRWARLVLLRGLERGRIDTTDDLVAVAVWYARLEPPPPAAAWVYDLHRLLGPYAARFALLHACVDGLRPHRPHHQLAHVAVRPGHGDAAQALLAAHHQTLDLAGLPSCAEYCGDRPGDGLLARVGYQPRSPVLLAPGGPALWRMWRPQPCDEQPCGSAGGGLPRRVRLDRTVTPFLGRVIPAAPSRSP
ncbi:N-acetyltransferase [Micromonospora parva]|uniref:N-acetyltransferase n=1 Tax=Micromonospora parva TaxID=1464048 RepID=A0ABW6VMV3_9ACTN|nr:N-acetyltransferase [Micromonospora parva]